MTRISHGLDVALGSKPLAQSALMLVLFL